MTAIRLVMDSASVTSPGGERLQVELAAALDRTCPDDASAVVLRRPAQEGLVGYSRLGAQCVGERLTTRWDKWQWIHRGLPAAARRCGATVVFAAGGVVSRRLRREFGLVVSSNNLLPFSPDQLRHYRPLSAAWLRLRLVRALTVRSLRAADAVVLHSRHALSTVSAWTGDIGAKTTVVLTGVPREMRLDAAAPPLPHPYAGRAYFLYFSAVRRYKNHLALIAAYQQLSRQIEDLPDLILAGVDKDAAYLTEIHAAIAAAGLAERVRYLGELPRLDVPAWLHHATVNVFPSLCEAGSVIQAEILGLRGVMACSAEPPMPELAGAVAEYFDPRDSADIARVLGELWRRPERREALRRLAQLRADELSWEACGEALWQAARRAAERREKRSV